PCASSPPSAARATAPTARRTTTAGSAANLHARIIRRLGLLPSYESLSAVLQVALPAGRCYRAVHAPARQFMSIEWRDGEEVRVLASGAADAVTAIACAFPTGTGDRRADRRRSGHMGRPRASCATCASDV